MAKKISRRSLLCRVAPLAAAFPLAGLATRASAGGHDDHPHIGHAAMIGDQAPAPGGPPTSTRS